MKHQKKCRCNHICHFNRCHCEQGDLYQKLRNLAAEPELNIFPGAGGREPHRRGGGGAATAAGRARGCVAPSFRRRVDGDDGHAVAAQGHLRNGPANGQRGRKLAGYKTICLSVMLFSKIEDKMHVSIELKNSRRSHDLDHLIFILSFLCVFCLPTKEQSSWKYQS